MKKIGLRRLFWGVRENDIWIKCFISSPAPSLHVAELFGTNKREGRRRVTSAFK